MYHRGTIVAVHESDYDVKFIDYSNIERCNQTDIYNKVMCSEIPIMSYKFQLPSLNVKVDQTLNDTLHSLIVDKICNINVLDNDDNLTPFCTITVDNTILNSFQDVVNFLIK